jgi:hypothetical protein
VQIQLPGQVVSWFRTNWTIELAFESILCAVCTRKWGNILSSDDDQLFPGGGIILRDDDDDDDDDDDVWWGE